MPELTEQLRRYGEAVERVADQPSQVGPDPPARRRGPRWLAAAAVVIAVAVITTLWMSRNDGADVELDAVGEAGSGLFSSPTGAVLVFSDGYDGVVAVDADAGLVGRRVIEGERAGDQPFRLTVVDDELVVGWGEIYGFPLGGGPSHLITEATTYIPASEPGELWVLDYAGGRLGQGQPTLRRVELDGTVVFSTNAFDPDRYWPLIGVPGGLAVATDDGIAIWDAETESLGETHGDGRPFAASTSGSLLAWCEDDCADPGTLELSRTGGPTPQHRSASPAPVFSPNGRLMAYVTPRPDGGHLIIHDNTTGQETTVASGLDGSHSVQWSPKGDQLFYASTIEQSGELRVLGRYQLESEVWETADIAVPSGLTVGAFVVLDRDRADELLPERPGTPEQCPAPSVFPSQRAGICGYLIED